MKRMNVSVYRTAVSIVILSLATAALVAPSPAGAADRYAVGTQADGTARWLADPLSGAPGVNPAHCTPTHAHPRPVILLPGTFVRVSQGFAALGPALANRGYCVYGLDYGDTVLSTLSAGRIGAVGDIPTSARELAASVADVRARTGARQVDLVGWSEGGLVARSYLAAPGAAATVHSLVQLSTPNHGTNFSGVLDLLTALGVIPLLGALETAAHVSVLDLLGCAACDQILAGSAYLTQLNAHSDTVPGVDYTVITTEHGLLNTPASTQALHGPRARTVSVQAACPGDTTDDLGIVYDPVALQYVLQALGAAKVGIPACG